MIGEMLKYVSNYTSNKDLVALKLDHSLRVHENMMKYASILDFKEDEIELAGVIGLLHDIGRFDQINIYHSLKPQEGFDHGERGVKILFESREIERFYQDKSKYSFIEFSILNHNRLKIEECEDDEKMKFARLIRDVDKLDIMYSLGVLNVYDDRGDESEISERVLKAIDDERPVFLYDIKTNNDIIVSKFAYAFDLNYGEFIDLFKKYLESYYHRVEYKEKFKNIYKKVMEYLDERNV